MGTNETIFIIIEFPKNREKFILKIINFMLFSIDNLNKIYSLSTRTGSAWDKMNLNRRRLSVHILQLLSLAFSNLLNFRLINDRDENR